MHDFVFSFCIYPKLLAFHEIHDFGKFPCHIIISSRAVGNQTVGAVFHPFVVNELSAAIFPQCIQRAVAKKTVELLRVLYFVARKKFTFFMAEKPKILGFLFQFLSSFLLGFRHSIDPYDEHPCNPELLAFQKPA